MARLADGDRSAFTEVFTRLWPELRRFAGRWLHDDGEADDVAQRALLSIMARAHEYEPHRDALAWAIGIAAWECRSSRRRLDRRREQPLLEHSSVEPSPEDAVIGLDLERAVLEVVGTLSPLDRVALGFGSGEAVSPPTARKRRQRALMRLREAWSRFHGGR
ncbi:RNA polymerase sigma factor [Paraliomyxa miuraensis]|nr:RNA polymerase sigma factor [Paraliomyxa miuraensis]